MSEQIHPGEGGGYGFPTLALGEACLLPQGIGLWVAPLEEEVNSNSGPALSPRENTQWQALSHPRRRLEWKQSRQMAKGLLSKTLGGPAESFELLSQEEGPPLVLRGGEVWAEGQLSISHTPCYVGVAFAPFPVGLDICDKADEARIGRIAHRAFSEAERALCGACPQGPAALWALKEAALKMQGGGVFRPGLASISVHQLCPPLLNSPRAKAQLYALPLAYVALVFG